MEQHDVHLSVLSPERTTATGNAEKEKILCRILPLDAKNERTKVRVSARHRSDWIGWQSAVSCPAVHSGIDIDLSDLENKKPELPLGRRTYFWR